MEKRRPPPPFGHLPRKRGGGVKMMIAVGVLVLWLMLIVRGITLGGLRQF